MPRPLAIPAASREPTLDDELAQDVTGTQAWIRYGLATAEHARRKMLRWLDERALLLFACTVLALVSVGTVLVFSASAKVAMESPSIGDPAFYLKKHALFVGIGLALCAIAMRIDAGIYLRHARGLFVGLLLLLALVLIPGLGTEFNGARRWFRLGPFGFQPSDAAKLILILVLAAYAVKRERWLKSFSRGFLPGVTLIGVVSALILMEPDFGTALFCAAVGVVVLLLAGVRARHLIPVALAALPLVAVIVLFKFDHVRPRLATFLDPGSDPKGAGYQINQALIALGAGGGSGVGLGQSRQALYYLPESETDFIFAILGEELGLAGTASVVGMFALMTIAGLRLAVRAPSRYGRLVIAGIVTAISLQAMINIAVVTASVPTKGISLPFISFGGSATCFYLLAVGIVLNIAGKIAPPPKLDPAPTRPAIHWHILRERAGAVARWIGSAIATVGHWLWEGLCEATVLLGVAITAGVLWVGERFSHGAIDDEDAVAGIASADSDDRDDEDCEPAAKFATGSADTSSNTNVPVAPAGDPTHPADLDSDSESTTSSVAMPTAIADDTSTSTSVSSRDATAGSQRFADSGTSTLLGAVAHARSGRRRSVLRRPMTSSRRARVVTGSTLLGSAASSSNSDDAASACTAAPARGMTGALRSLGAIAAAVVSAPTRLLHDRRESSGAAASDSAPMALPVIATAKPSAAGAESTDSAACADESS